MPLIFFSDADPVGHDRLRRACSQRGLAGMIAAGLADALPGCVAESRPQFALGRNWTLDLQESSRPVLGVDDAVGLEALRPVRIGRHRWHCLFPGRYAARFNERLLAELLRREEAEVVLVTADPRLEAYRESATLSAQGELTGFRRFYADQVLRDACPQAWPQAIFLRARARVREAFREGLPLGYREFLQRCAEGGLGLRSFRVAGQVLDIESEAGLLRLIAHELERTGQGAPYAGASARGEYAIAARTAGAVLLGDDIEVAEDAVLLGPVVLGEGSNIGPGAVIENSIIGPGREIPGGCVVRDRVLLNGEAIESRPQGAAIESTSRWQRSADGRRGTYRRWSRFSYAEFWKRLADIVVAAGALLLFAPVLPWLALAVKISSPGPVFYRAKRQGRYGKEFHCLKFRSMMTGADRLQQLLRKRNQVDGPQFKMADDPRITRVGAFLRDTYLDEIPQFFNVLAGQMSVVGPRPSPEEENMLCPWWRDARLSVRPGVTGLWQICRTRAADSDFQEWIQYDTQYVRDLSWKLDLWICWRTGREFLWRFLRKF